MSGTSTDRADSQTFPIWNLPPGKYCIHVPGGGVTTIIVVQRNGKNLWLIVNGDFEILAGDVIKYWYMTVPNGTTIDETIYPYIVPGTTAPTTYKPYIGQTNTMNLPETVYGGTLDVESGVLTVDWAIDVKASGDIRESGDGTVFVIPAKYNCRIPYYILCNCINRFSHTGNYYRANKSHVGYETLTELQEALGDTPIQICYKLETPYAIQLTPQQIAALSGVNTLYTNADGVVVTGAEDPKHTITELKNAIISLGGNV